MKSIIYVLVFVSLLSVITPNQGYILKGTEPSPTPSPTKSPSPSPSPSPTPTYVITNRYTNITTRVGENFLIKLYGNPTTGSNWYLTKINNSRLAALNLTTSNTGEFVPFNSNAGSPGYLNFLFQALSPTSSTILEFDYLDVDGNLLRRRTIYVRILS
jgi:predicted secreted protein